MITEMKIEELKEQFTQWLEEEQGIGCTADCIVRTADSVQGFIDACREIGGIDDDVMDGMPVKILRQTQRQKDEPRSDLYILDADVDVRLVLNI